MYLLFEDNLSGFFEQLQVQLPPRLFLTVLSYAVGSNSWSAVVASAALPDGAILLYRRRELSTTSKSWLPQEYASIEREVKHMGITVVNGAMLVHELPW